MRRLLPRTLLSQVAWFTILALILAQVAGFWLFSGVRAKEVRADQRSGAIEHVMRLADLLNTSPPSEHRHLVEAATSDTVQISVSTQPGVTDNTISGGNDQTGLRSQEVIATPDGVLRPPAGLIWLRKYMMSLGIAPAELRLSLPLADGKWLNATTLLEQPGLPLPPQVLASTLLTLALLLMALWLGLRRITRPLSELASVADEIGLGNGLPQLPHDGLYEAQALSEALARMHVRLTQMVAEKTQMLAALGHDLRSPITALRLRAEMVDDDETRERMIAILDEMQDMAETTLAFARGVSVSDPMEPTDLPDLLYELASELSAVGPSITVTKSVPLTLPLRRIAIRRALRNLLENAQRYGDETQIELSCNDDEIWISIDDNGPGIPEADLERVFDPFVRLESSRSRDTGGTGLGLAISRSILRAHGGDVSLANRTGDGLRATVRLPIQSPE